jgi:two-component system CheB/CheR fusion protein
MWILLAAALVALAVVASRLAAARRALKARDDRLAQVTHELRGPLQPIALAVSRLSRDETISSRSREAVEVIARNLDAESRLVEDLFEACRGDRPLSVRPEACDLNALVCEVAEAAAERIVEKRLALETRLDPSGPWVLADPVRLRQIARNLLDNAIKFTPPGGRIAVRTERGAGRHVVLAVTDTGPGIPRQDRERIFEPYAQLAGASAAGGLGLGLYLVRKLVAAQSGTVTVETEPDRGATFTVSLPQAAVPPARAAGAAAVEAPPARVLLVEDHEDSARLIAELLGARGFVVTTAAGLESALRSAAATSFDVLVSDLELPDGTGLDLMRRLRAAGIPAGVALSGRRTEQDLVASRSAGFAAHLLKPVDVDELVRAIGSITRR